MTMMYRSPDGSFIIHDTSPSSPLPKCLHVQPGVVDFPGRCHLKPGHIGQHAAPVIYIGVSGAELFAPEKWDA